MGTVRMLSAKTRTYASAGLPQDQDRTGAYFPDDVVDPFVQHNDDVISTVFQAQRRDEKTFASMAHGARDIAVIDPKTNEPRKFSLEQSRKLVVAALTEFDPGLGARAQDILSRRLEIRDTGQVPRGERQQQYIPWDAKDDKTGQYDPHAGNIRYDFLNGTIDDVIMLGHETGHGIADDYVTEHGERSGDFRESVPETQAYFIQHIVYDYLKRHPDKGLSEAAGKHFDATMSRNMTNLAIAGVARDAQMKLNNGEDFNANRALTENLGPGWEQYQWARDVRNVIVAAQKAQSNPDMPHTDRKVALDKLDDEVRYIHGRPMSILSALALFRQAQGQTGNERIQTIETLMGRNGPPSVLNAFSAAGIDYTDAMNASAENALMQVAGLPEKTMEPEHRPQTPVIFPT